ncbi:uncharacterized protein METZ01_LOCUS162316, partial [marine metagenome]
VVLLITEIIPMMKNIILNQNIVIGIPLICSKIKHNYNVAIGNDGVGGGRE